jgi:hypothetical protein
MPGGMNPAATLGTAPPVKAKEVNSELRDIAKEIGVLEYQSDEYDIPTFLRKQAD